jgi:ketosteroid isomerase-like protein
MMRAVMSMLLLVPAVLVAQAESGNSARREADRQELIRCENLTVTATDSRDLATLDRLIGDDLISITFKGAIRNKAQVIASWTSNAPKNAAGEETTTSVTTTLNDMQVRVNGDMAVVTGLDRAVFQQKAGGSSTSEARFTDVWERRAVGWQLIAHQAARVMPPETAPAAAAASTLAEEFTARLQHEADVETHGEESDFMTRTDARYLMTDERGAVHTRDEWLKQPHDAESRKRMAAAYAEAAYSARIDDVQANQFGDAAVVNYRLSSHLTINGEPVVKQLRYTQLFVRRDGKWLSVSKQETAIPQSPVAATVDTRLYDRYAGQYRLSAQRTYTVTRDGQRLLWGASNPRELVPENDDTFVISGDQYRVIFVRDASGNVTHLRLREFPGVEYSAIRIPSPAPKP